MCGGFGLSLFFVAPFSLLAVFQGATAFADNNFFCAGSTNTGSWPTSVIRASDFVGSGVTDFSCGSNHLNNIIIKSVVDDWCGTEAAKKTAVQTAHGSIEDWDVSRITNMKSLFASKSSFNANLSNWNTGAVTTMEDSKCTLSLSLSLWSRRLLLWCVVEYIRLLEVRRGTSLTRVVLVFGCGLKRDLVVVVVCVVGLVFLFSLLRPSYFLQCFIRQLRSIRTCPNGTCPKSQFSLTCLTETTRSTKARGAIQVGTSKRPSSCYPQTTVSCVVTPAVL